MLPLQGSCFDLFTISGKLHKDTEPMDSKKFNDILADRCGLSPEETMEMTKALTEIVTESALEQDSVSFPGFGTFEGRKRNERLAVHPSTGKRMLVPPKLTLAFKPSVLLKQKVKSSVDKSPLRE